MNAMSNKALEMGLCTLEFEGHVYQVRETKDPDGDYDILVGTEDLEAALIKDGEPVSPEAAEIDNGIYCYVSTRALLEMTNEQFRDYVACDFEKEEEEFLK